MDDRTEIQTTDVSLQVPGGQSGITRPATASDTHPAHSETTTRDTALRPGDSLPALTLRIDPHSHKWRRQLGPLPWAALEHLALSGQRDREGWIAPIGVRNIAAGIGVTKDTAARAVMSLRAAGLVTRDRVTAPDGRSRPAYRLTLPSGVEIEGCPDTRDAVDREDVRALILAGPEPTHEEPDGDE